MVGHYKINPQRCTSWLAPDILGGGKGGWAVLKGVAPPKSKYPAGYFSGPLYSWFLTISSKLWQTMTPVMRIQHPSASTFLEWRYFIVSFLVKKPCRSFPSPYRCIIIIIVIIIIIIIICPQ